MANGEHEALRQLRRLRLHELLAAARKVIDAYDYVLAYKQPDFGNFVQAAEVDRRAQLFRDAMADLKRALRDDNSTEDD